MYQLFLGLLSAIPILRRDRPDIVLAMGSYSSFAPVAGAIVLRIPYILHEANVIPGRLVSMMTSKANAIAISFESSRYYIKHPMVVDTGMPLRIDLQRKITTPKEIENNKFCILITGGSRGAKKLNEVIPLALKKLNIQHKFKVIHLIGLNQIEPVKKIYEESKIEAEVLTYVHNIEKYYDECDLVISRSGASTCAELCAFGKPSLLIPYPYAVHDHQMFNARALEKAGAADVIAQKDLTVDWLTSYLSQVIRDPERRRKQIFSATQLAKINAADSVSNLLEQVCNERG